VNGGGTVTSSQILAPDGTVGAPSYSFASSPSTGWYRTGSALGFSGGGTAQVLLSYTTNGDVRVASTGGMSWSSTADATQTGDLFLLRDAANTLAQKNGSANQVFRLYNNTTGPVYWSTNARVHGVLFTAVGGAAQISVAQTTAPTCSSNCGTSPSVAGTDTGGIVTMGATGVPASGWVVTFNGTWPAAPSCIVQSALASMVVGKMPIAVVTTTTTMTVTTNGTAPAAADKYQFHCLGVS
jgi:hypothetical protein